MLDLDDVDGCALPCELHVLLLRHGLEADDDCVVDIELSDVVTMRTWFPSVLTDHSVPLDS